MGYNHTQRGTLNIVILVLLALYFVFILQQTAWDGTMGIIMLVVLILVSSFSSLNVQVDEYHVRIRFGWGLFRKRFALDEIVSATGVKNHWYYGWGIRYWWPSRMWIFNVSGYDAIELKMKNGRTYRIGTDDPKELGQAIQHTNVRSLSSKLKHR